jgi:predicted ribosome quality control (RQC) complex YloA/Tae2 family protein
MKSVIYQIYDIEYDINIGQNAKDNWKLLDKSESTDIWFHLDNYSSPYVILLMSKNETISDIPNEVIKYCGLLCKENSKYKNLNNLSVIYTEIKNLTKGKEIGSVITKKTKKIII